MLLLSFLVACGGDSGDDTPGPPAATAGDPSAGPAAATGGGGSSSSQALDLTNVATSLQDLDSFRYDFSLSLDFDAPAGATGSAAAGAAMLAALFGDIRAEGIYVAPDRASVSLVFLGTRVQSIQIGAESWFNDGSGWQDAETSGDVPFGSFGADSQSPFGFLPEGVLEGAEKSEESVNGVQATRYSFDKESLAALAETYGEEMGDLAEVEDMDLDVWLSDEGYPVKFLLSAMGESEGSPIGLELEFNISDVNDPGIRIDPPSP